MIKKKYPIKFDRQVLEYVFKFNFHTLYTKYLGFESYSIKSFGIGFEMLFRPYIGGLFGLEYQVKANKFLIAWGIVRNGVIKIN